MNYGKTPKEKDPILSSGWGPILLRATNIYRPPLLDALIGLTLAWAAAVATICVAKLQLPLFHLIAGSGQDVQYQPDSIWVARPHPWHEAVISWHSPLL
jgi:hypothetical protein